MQLEHNVSTCASTYIGKARGRRGVAVTPGQQTTNNKAPKSFVLLWHEKLRLFNNTQHTQMSEKKEEVFDFPDIELEEKDLKLEEYTCNATQAFDAVFQ